MLSYIIPEVKDGKFVAQLDKAEVHPKIKIYKCALVVYVIGQLPEYNYMNHFVAQKLVASGKPQISIITSKGIT